MKSEMSAQLTTWAKATEQVRALLLTSSRARPEAQLDQFSDWDVIVVVDNGEQFAGDDSWIDRLGTPLVVFRTTQRVDAAEVPARLALYESGAKIDFAIWPTALLKRLVNTGDLPAELDAGYAILVDKDRLASELAKPTLRAYIPTRPTAQEFQSLVEEFWWETTYVAKNLARDELFPAKYSFESVIKQDLLRRILEWSVETTNDWSIRPGARGRGIKQKVGTKLWAEIEATFAGSSIDENWQALFRTIELFRRLATAVAKSLGYEYPQQLDSRVTAYLLHVRQGRGFE
jgi:aminoglycoside 6-adenylyltransferase